MAGKDDLLIDHTFELGDLVWAKMKWCKPWPGFIADFKGPRPKKRANFMWIYFFGYDNYRWIDTKSIRPYVPKPLDTSKSSQLFRDACAAIKVVYKYKNSKFNSLNKDNTSFNKLVSEAPTKTPEPSTSKAKTSKNKSPAKNSNQPIIQQAQNVSEVSVSGTKKGKNPRRGIVRQDSIKSDASQASSEENIVKPKKRCSTSAVSEAKRFRTQHSDADSTTTSGSASCFNNDSPSPTPRLTMTVNPVVDKPDLVCPEFVQLQVFQTFIRKNIVPSNLKFGFIGLGNMGSGIVQNLLNSGHRVVIWNRTTEKTKKFIVAGAKVAETPQDVIQMADITFSCVSDTQAVKDVMFGNYSALDKINETKAYVEMSTIDIETSKLLSDAVTSKGGRYLEAQLQGSRHEAEEGILVVLSAGDESLYKNCLSCFEAIGRCAFFLGEVGSATKMNLVIQLMSGVCLASCTEALALGSKIGLQVADVHEILGLTKLSNPFIQEKVKNIINLSFKPDHALGLMQKDLDLVINMSQIVNQPVPLAAAANGLYKRAKQLGYGDLDSSAVVGGSIV